MTKYFYHALKVDEKRCIGCSNCMKNCPTEAIRLRGGKAKIYENRCIDCGECYKVCPSGAVFIEQDDFEDIYKYKYRVVLVPAVFLGQFPPEIKASQVYSTLKEIGFTNVIEIEAAAPIYNEARDKYFSENDERPLISTFCPAVVRLIQVKFPALVDNLITIKAPVDITAMYVKKRLLEQGAKEEEIGLFYITPCAAKIAAIKSPVGEDKSIITGVINMDFCYNKVFKQIKLHEKDYKPKLSHNQVTSDGVVFSLSQGEKRTFYSEKSYAIDNIKHISDFLEKVENDEVKDVDFIEARACDQGCPGGILTCGNRFMIYERIMQRMRKIAERERNGEVERKKDITKDSSYLLKDVKVSKILPRSMMVLDEDISVALEKLDKIRQIEAHLPQTDCCVCGAPTCHALAEDIVCKRAEMTDCVFIQRNLEKRGGLTTDESIDILKKIWGEEKLKDYILKK
jgi:iron only hydrogenase large subunit-like protein